MKEEKLLENTRKRGSYAVQKLESLKESHAVIGSIRSVGLMIGIEIVNPITGEPNQEGLMKILDLSLEKGVLFYLCGNHSEVIRMIPPLIVTKEQIDKGLKMLDGAITEYEGR